MDLGPNQSLIGRADFARDFATPALVIDLDALEANLRTMADLAKRHRRQLRPHVKAHKSVEIGRRQLAAGAVGLCCATVREVEAMAGGGLSGLLMTAPVLAPAQVARLARARDRVAELIVVVDSAAGIDALAACARADRPIGVLIDVDMGLGRTGCTDPEQAVRLARLVAAAPQLHYRGVQAYYGHLQHIPGLAERQTKAAEQWRRLAHVLDALKDAGLTTGIVSGGGTGTHHFDLADGPFTEIQPGSYLFMDKQYGAIELTPGTPPFRVSLGVVTRVVSTAQPDRVIVDAGSKAMATDAGPPLIAAGAAPEAAYQFMGDEHGALRFAEGGDRPELGSLVRLVPPHCDPTVNLHDNFHIFRDERLIDIWPVDARGY